MRSPAVFLMVVITMAATAGATDLIRKGFPVSDQEYTADSVLNQADDIFQERDYPAALDKYQEVVEAARREFNRSVEVEALAQIARLNLVLDRKEEGRQWLKEAEARATDSDPMGWSRYLGVKGRFEWKDNDLVSARKTFDAMYTYCHVNALWGRAVDAANMMAIVAETPEEQIEWSRQGIEAAEAADQEKWLGPLWNNLAATYYDIKQFDSALTCYLKAREYHWRFSTEKTKLLADYSVGMAYRATGDIENAGKWLRPALAWAERIDDQYALAQICEDLGEVYLAKKDRAEGLRLLQRARDLYIKAQLKDSWPEAWERINNRINELKG